MPRKVPNKPRPATKAPNPVGRPSKYEPSLADEICRRLANGESLVEISQGAGMPAESTVRLWAIEDREGFSAKYARAREAQAEYWAEEIVRIADDGTNDWMARQQGNDTVTVPDHEHMQRSRLRVDTRKWLLSKLLPKKYGDLKIIEATHTHISAEQLSDAELADIAAGGRPGADAPALGATKPSKLH